MIFVAGATGNSGSEVVNALAAAGERVRALTRDPAGSSFPPGVEAVAGDLNDPATLEPALAGVQAAYLLSGYADMPGLLDAIRRAGVRRVVLLSSSAVPGGDLDNAVARYHILSEQAVRESGVAWTMLRPNSFMSNALRWLPQLRTGDVVREPFAGVPVAAIDPADLAAVAVQALTTDAHEGRSYRLSGPEPTLPADRLRILAEVLGRDLRLEPLSDQEARAQFTADGVPDEYVAAFFSFFVDGRLDESEVLPTVEEILGRPPRTFREWAVAHAGAFR